MYRLDAADQALLARVRDLVRDEVAPHAAATDAEARFPRAGITALGRAGLLGLTVPSKHGGLARGPRMACAALDEIARACPSTAMVYLMHLCGIACYVAAPDKAGAALDAAARGVHLTTLAWSERGSRSHFWAPMSQAVASAGGVTVSAEKSFVTSAGEADGYVVSARSPSATSATDTALYLAFKADPGLAVAGPWNAMGMRGNASAPMRLTNVRFGPERELAAPGTGFGAMLGTVLPIFSLGNAAISVGIAEGAILATRAHLVGTRFEHSGTSLADLANLRERLARMRIRTDGARAHLASAIDAVERPGEATQLLVLEIKAAGAEAALFVTDLAMAACGGAAFGRHLAVERLFRDARASAVMAPTIDHAHDFIGRALCGLPLF